MSRGTRALYDESKTTFTVYRIVHVDSGMEYVGSTDNLRRRIKAHKSTLKRGCHNSRRMQKFYNQCIKSAKSFKVRVEVLDTVKGGDSCKRREQVFIDDANKRGVLLNSSSKVCFLSDPKRISSAKRLWENLEYRERCSKNAIAYKRSSEGRKAQSRNAKETWVSMKSDADRYSDMLARRGSTREENGGRVPKEIVIAIYDRATSGKETQREIAQSYGVTRSVVTHIKNRYSTRFEAIVSEHLSNKRKHLAA